jgi:hypothetical protein
VNAYTSLALSSFGNLVTLSTTTPSPIIVTGLTIGTPYYFSIYASNIRGAGIPSDISSTAVIPLGPPGPPRNITMTSIDYNSGTFSFLAPLNNGGSAVTNYTAEIYKNTDTKIDIHESQNFKQENGYKYHLCIRLSTSLGYVYSNVLTFNKLASPVDSYYNLTSF